MHRILERQIKRYLGEHAVIPPKLKALLESISETYTHLDEDRALLDRSLETSSKEFLENNRRLEAARVEVEQQAQNLAQQVAKRTKELDERVTELEGIRRAMTNLLEDLEAEKNKEEALAKDLEKFKLAMDNVSDNIVITDPQGIVVYANKSIEKIIGYKPEEVVGKKSGSLWKSPMSPAYYENLWNTITKQKKVFTGEIQNKRKNGEIYTAEISISPIVSKEGVVLFFVSIERDVTREREIERAKSEFVSLASHQLRTPPSIIGWYTETLQSEDLGPINQKQMEYLNEIYRANQRMIAVINSLLNISRIEMGTFTISPKDINIKEVIDETIKELTSRFGRKANITTDYDSALGIVRIDPDIMEIIIDNLLSNAFKYSPPENTVITITTKRENDSLLVSIKDNGIGIPLKNQGQIFEKLFRADNAVSTSPDGTGLGLYMTKKIIVDGLGGKIWFQSKENDGTTFFISIPISGMEVRQGTTTLVRTSALPPHSEKGVSGTFPKDGSLPFPPLH